MKKSKQRKRKVPSQHARSHLRVKAARGVVHEDTFADIAQAFNALEAWLPHVAGFSQGDLGATVNLEVPGEAHVKLATRGRLRSLLSPHDHEIRAALAVKDDLPIIIMDPAGVFTGNSTTTLGKLREAA